MTRPDEWARVDYRSRATAAICVIATTLVAFVTLTAYVATQVGFAEGVLLPTPPREAAFVAPNCPPRYVHQIFGLKGDDEEMPTPWRRAQKTWLNRHRAVEVEDPVVLAPGAIAEEWKYVLWSKDAVDALMRTDYPRLWAAYRSYPRWVQRADMARYAILHKYGGIYLCGNQQACRVRRQCWFRTSSGEESTPPRHRAGVASMAWIFRTNTPQI